MQSSQLHRAYAPPENWGSDAISLSKEEGHHLRHVLRLGPGQQVVVFDGSGSSVRGVISKKDADTICKVAPPDKTARGFSPVLIQAFPKGRRMDNVIEKVTELGVAFIVLFVSDRTVLKLNSRQIAGKLERWERIAVGAAKQCGTNWLPQIQAAKNLQEAVNLALPLDILMTGSLEEEAESAREAIRKRHTPDIRKAGMLIGPEGDFSPDEYELARSMGALPVGFGSTVLRTDTAAIHAISILSYEFRV